MNEILLVSNPSRRRKSKGRKRSRVRLKRHASRRRKSYRVKRARYRRNPSFSLKSLPAAFLPTLKAGAVGAVGAIANDALIGQVGRFLPSFLASGYARHLTKVGTAVIVGAVGNLALKGKGSALAAGAATVAMRDLIRETIQQNLPSVAPYLGDYDSEAEGMNNIGAYNPGLLVEEGVGAYVPGGVGDVGEYIPMMGGGDDM